jgi:hypothetical protein
MDFWSGLDIANRTSFNVLPFCLSFIGFVIEMLGCIFYLSLYFKLTSFLLIDFDASRLPSPT